jgi:hypothetical protein
MADDRFDFVGAGDLTGHNFKVFGMASEIAVGGRGFLAGTLLCDGHRYRWWRAASTRTCASCRFRGGVRPPIVQRKTLCRKRGERRQAMNAGMAKFSATQISITVISRGMRRLPAKPNN